jgi:enolase-phosphatase E1
VSPRADDSRVQLILLDIEGTTTPVDFVYKTLFPYASRKLESFLRQHFQEQETQSLIAELLGQHRRDESDGLAPPVWKHDSDEARLRSSITYAQWLMARDSKCPPLKALQGKIWREGYERRELRGEVYADVPRAFARWGRQGREICIYSSGSVLAQQLLFRSVGAGDLTPHISSFFDTRIGAKTESESYRKIAASLRRPPEELLFISDALKEIEAAQAAGMQTVLCVRDGSAPRIADHAIFSFDEIFPE